LKINSFTAEEAETQRNAEENMKNSLVVFTASVCDFASAAVKQLRP
jgi:hypothetical protein